MRGGNFLKAKIRVIFLLSDRPELLNVTCSTHFFGLKPYLFKKDCCKIPDTITLKLLTRGNEGGRSLLERGGREGGEGSLET